jgi:hypothetical protein
LREGGSRRPAGVLEVGSSYCGDWLLIGSELLTEEMKQKNGGGL